MFSFRRVEKLEVLTLSEFQGRLNPRGGAPTVGPSVNPPFLFAIQVFVRQSKRSMKRTYGAWAVEFLAYYHEDRTYLGPDRDTPSKRPIKSKPDRAELESQARVGGLHHRYIWKVAA